MSILDFFGLDFDDDVVADDVKFKHAADKSDSFWKQDISFFIKLDQAKYLLGEKLLEWQKDKLASSIIIEDFDAAVEVQMSSINSFPKLSFPPGALLSGSFVMSIVAKAVGHIDLKYDDIDVYFKNKGDAESFVKANAAELGLFDFGNNPMCAYGHYGAHKMNLIYGVEYDSPQHLISRFDIRACSMAIDANLGVLYVVRGSIEDATRKIIAFNPVPRGVSVRRLVKYVNKGFTLDSHQGVFFVELCRSDLYSAELELMTNKY